MYRLKGVPVNYQYFQYSTHVIKSGWGKSTQLRKNNNNRVLHNFLIEVIQTLVKKHKNSFNVFSKWRHSCTK